MCYGFCRRAYCIAFSVGVMLAFSAFSRAATVQEVEDAIRRGKEFLYSVQKDGNWEHLPAPDQFNRNRFSHDGLQWGMATATATYGLLAAGESSQDDRLKEAIAFLRTADIRGIYALGMRCQVWLLLPRSDENKRAMQRDLNLLLQSVLAEPKNRGLFDYSCPPRNAKTTDLEVAAYGMLALSALADSGANVPAAYWTALDQTWRMHQNSDGGWPYTGTGRPGDAPSVESASGAGVTALFLTEKYLRRTAVCKGNFRDEARERGLQYVSKSPIDKSTELHWMYLYQRITAASAMKRFGDADWYEKISNTLIELQAPDGSWYDIIARLEQPGNRVVGTGYGLVMLSYGRAPLVVNKLRYDVIAGNERNEAKWNQRPRDIANVVEWVGEQMEYPVNWQIVDIGAPVSELLEAPILYLSGNETLGMSDEQVAHLREYVQAGGLILGNADCGSKEFATSFRSLGQKLFPNYEFRDLPADHVILARQQFKLDAKVIRARALSNGVRELMILLDGDPARTWQINNPRSRQADFQFLANLYQYVSDKSRVRYKGDTYLVYADSNIKVARRETVARLQYDGNWDPEPGGWVRFANILHNTQQTELVVQRVQLGKNELSAKQYRFAHLTTTQSLKLTDAQRAEILAYVNDGGTLLVDAAGGNEQGVDALNQELHAIFGTFGNPVPSDHAIYKSPVDLSRPAFRVLSINTSVIPKLHVITVQNRAAVYYSRSDFSAALVGQPVDGLLGYDPSTAVGLLTNIFAAGTSK